MVRRRSGAFLALAPKGRPCLRAMLFIAIGRDLSLCLRSPASRPCSCCCRRVRAGAIAGVNRGGALAALASCGAPGNIATSLD